MNMDDLTRRDFIKTASATVAVSALAPTALASDDETGTRPEAWNAKDAPYWRPYGYRVLKPGRVWWPLLWKDLKPGHIVMWVSPGPDKVIDNKGTEKQYQLITGEPAKFGGVWGVKCRPFTVIRASDAANETNDTWQPVSAWKDGERVPLVQEVDLRTHMMKRIPLNDWRLDHFLRCSEPGYGFDGMSPNPGDPFIVTCGKKAADYELIEEPFDYITLESQEWESGPPLIIVPPTRHVLGLPRDFALREMSNPGKTVGILHDVESDDEGFTAGLMYLTSKHINESYAPARWSFPHESRQRYDFQDPRWRLVYDFQGTMVTLDGWQKSFVKDGVWVFEGARLRKASPQETPDA